MIYAGIGPRKTPQATLEIMTHVGIQMEKYGFLLRSGGAIGADQAWAKMVSRKEIFIPKQKRYGQQGIVVDPDSLAYLTAQEIAASQHRKWHDLDDFSKKLFTRNVFILLGEDLSMHADLVLYGDNKRVTQGGTGHSLRVARMYGIPCFNICDNKDQKYIEVFIEQLMG